MDLELEQMITSVGGLKIDPKLNAERKVRELQSYADHLHKELIRFDDLVKRDLMTKTTRKVEKEKLCGQILKELKRYKNPYSAQLEKLHKQLSGDEQANRSDLAQVLSFLQKSEVRRAYNIYEMDSVELESRLSEDPLLVDAVLGSPVQVLPPERITELAQQKAKAENPALAEQMEKVEIANKTITGIADAIEQHIMASGFQGGDEIVKIAGGM
ncbi:MAG: hypothetical protein ISS66_21560 [Desulfobacteraceae bacterium]|nr:hypothetical protein [Desulfobacteraceae bacterium]